LTQAVESCCITTMAWRLKSKMALLAVMPAALLSVTASALAEMEAPVARITGMVLDDENKPVAGAEVYTPKDRRDTTTTNQEGKFVLDLKNSRSPIVCYTDVVAVAEGGKRLGVLSVQDNFEASTDIRIGTRAPREVRVKVVDGKGAPVADAEVGATYEGLHAAFTGGKTNAEGKATLLLPALRRLHCVVAVKPGAGLDYIKGEDVFPANTNIDVGNPVDLQLKLDGVRPATVEANDAQGRFVSDAEFHPGFIGKKGKPRGTNGRTQVNLNGFEFLLPSMQLRTNREGRAVVDWMPSDLEYPLLFQCSGDDWAAPKSCLYSPTDPKASCSVTLLSTVKLSGKVLLPNDKPAVGIIVQAEGRGPQTMCRKYARTAADGRFEVIVFPEQEYMIGVLDKNWASDNLTGLFIGEGDTLADVSLKLKKGTLVHGRVIGGTGKRNDSGVVVTQSVGKGALVRYASVDPKGEYSIRLGNGSYMINSYASRQEMLIVSDEERIEKNFDLTDQ